MEQKKRARTDAAKKERYMPQKPGTLTARRASLCLPFPRRISARTLRGEIQRIENVWPDNRFTSEEAGYVLELSKSLDDDMVGLLILGEQDRVLGRLLRRAAKRALRDERREGLGRCKWFGRLLSCPLGRRS